MTEIKELALQALTLDQWKTWIFLIVITSAVTETAKRVFFLRMAKLRRRQWVYGTAFVVGVLAGAAGFVMVGTAAIPDYYWALFAATSGPIANFLHWLTLGLIAWKFPGAADVLKGRGQ